MNVFLQIYDLFTLYTTIYFKMFNMAKVIFAPNKIDKSKFTVFLAGSIDMGKAKDWQQEIEDKLKEDDVILFNPRRPDWDCVDCETKAMTNNGIKSYNQIDINNDLILSWNKINNSLEYVKIDKLNIYQLHNEEILEFKRNNDKFYFTKNHKLINRKSSKTNTYDFYNASFFINKLDSVRTLSNLILPKSNSGILIPEGDSFLDEHFKLAAWILSEGSIFKKNDKWKITIAQYIINEHKIKKIKELLNALDIHYSYDGRQFSLDNDAVNFILGIMEIEKYKIPKWIKNASFEQKRIFVTEYGYGDGSFVDNKLKYVAFSEKYRKFAEEFQILCYEAAISTKLQEKTSGFGHPVINVSMNNFDKKSLSMKYNQTINYNGIVWCPTNKNHSWVAVRNGTPFLTGNSSWEESITNPLFREQVEWELNALEEADMIVVYFDPKGKAPITLMELGLHKDDKIIVCCPDGYHKKGNVDVVCHKYNIKQVDDIDGLVKEIKTEAFTLDESITYKFKKLIK